jgi:prolyl 4-hydroxylase
MDQISAETAHLMALRAGEGLGVPQDWQAALDLLRRSAELGFPLAQSSLAALAGEWALANEIANGELNCPVDWSRLSDSIELINWLASPRPRIVSASPRIAVVEEFASPQICDWLIARARPKLAPAKVYDLVTGGPANEPVRTNSECHFPTSECDLVLQLLRRRIADVTETAIAGLEATAVLHYVVGQEFMPHYDFLDDTQPGPAKNIAESGQRVLTLLLSLNDDYEGGATIFPALGRSYRGRRGSALFFWNVEPDGTPDRRVLHAGVAPTRGEKWMLSQWVRGPALR